MIATTSDGVRLALRHVPASGARRGTALFTHAMMANGGYMGRFARYAAERGIEAFVLDFRGHGKSVPPMARGGDWCFDDLVERDLPTAVQAITAAIGVPPDRLAYVGHSLGGLVALAALGTGRIAPFARLCLVATSVWHPGPGGPLVRRAICAGLDWMSRPLGYLPVRAFRVGTDDEARGYCVQFADWARTGRWSSRLGVDYLAGLSTIPTPTLGVVGGADRLTTEADVRELTSRLSGPTRIVTAPRAHHFGFFVRPESRLLWPTVCDHLSGEG